MTLNEKECEKALNRIVDDSFNKYCDYKTQNAWGIMSKLIKEYFEPQPYKFEDLKPNMWVWDDKLKRCVNCDPAKNSMGIDCIWYWYDYDFEGELSEDYIEFEENRFFPITKALQYQGELK